MHQQNNMRNFSFIVTQDVLNLGVKIITTRIFGVKNFKTNNTLDEFIETQLCEIKQDWQNKNWKEDKILEGFRTLHTKVGRSNRDYPASPEVLLKNHLEKDRFPRINAIVDLYNLISLQTQLALGAHNIEKIDGNVTLRLTGGKEHFLPLGKTQKEKIFPGEYAYCDDGNNIICRLETIQVEPTKITEEATDIFFIIQGNENTTIEYIRRASENLVQIITNFCGGSGSLLTSFVI